MDQTFSSLEYDNSANADAMLARNMIMLPHLVIHSSLHYLSTGRLREVKSKGKFELLAITVVVVAYEGWSLARGSKCSDLTCKPLVFWKTGR